MKKSDREWELEVQRDMALASLDAANSEVELLWIQVHTWNTKHKVGFNATLAEIKSGTDKALMKCFDCDRKAPVFGEGVRKRMEEHA